MEISDCLSTDIDRSKPVCRLIEYRKRIYKFKFLFDDIGSERTQAGLDNDIINAEFGLIIRAILALVQRQTPIRNIKTDNLLFCCAVKKWRIAREITFMNQDGPMENHLDMFVVNVSERSDNNSERNGCRAAVRVEDIVNIGRVGNYSEMVPASSDINGVEEHREMVPASAQKDGDGDHCEMAPGSVETDTVKDHREMVPTVVDIDGVEEHRKMVTACVEIDEVGNHCEMVPVFVEINGDGDHREMVPDGVVPVSTSGIPTSGSFKDEKERNVLKCGMENPIQSCKDDDAAELVSTADLTRGPLRMHDESNDDAVVQAEDQHCFDPVPVPLQTRSFLVDSAHSVHSDSAHSVHSDSAHSVHSDSAHLVHSDSAHSVHSDSAHSCDLQESLVDTVNVWGGMVSSAPLISSPPILMDAQCPLDVLPFFQTIDTFVHPPIVSPSVSQKNITSPTPRVIPTLSPSKLIPSHSLDLLSMFQTVTSPHSPFIPPFSPNKVASPRRPGTPPLSRGKLTPPSQRVGLPVASPTSISPPNLPRIPLVFETIPTNRTECSVRLRLKAGSPSRRRRKETTKTKGDGDTMFRSIGASTCSPMPRAPGTRRQSTEIPFQSTIAEKLSTHLVDDDNDDDSDDGKSSIFDGSIPLVLRRESLRRSKRLLELKRNVRPERQGPATIVERNDIDDDDYEVQSRCTRSSSMKPTIRGKDGNDVNKRREGNDLIRASGWSKTLHEGTTKSVECQTIISSRRVTRDAHRRGTSVSVNALSQNEKNSKINEAVHPTESMSPPVKRRSFLGNLLSKIGF